MKKAALLISALSIVTLLAACASTGPAATAQVKCPACGHEFNYQAGSK